MRRDEYFTATKKEEEEEEETERGDIFVVVVVVVIAWEKGIIEIFLRAHLMWRMCKFGCRVLKWRDLYYV